MSTMTITAAIAPITRRANGLSFFTNVMIISMRVRTKKIAANSTSLTMPEPKLTVPAPMEANARERLWTCVAAAIMPMANRTTTTRGTSHGRSPVRVRWKQASNT